AYAKEIDEEKLHERVAFCTNIQADRFLMLNELDTPPGVAEGNLQQTNPSKFLLWQDVLLGLFDKHIEGLDLDRYYESLRSEEHTSELQSRFDLVCRLLLEKKNLI